MQRLRMLVVATATAALVCACGDSAAEGGADAVVEDAAPDLIETPDTAERADTGADAATDADADADAAADTEADADADTEADADAAADTEADADAAPDTTLTIAEQCFSEILGGDGGSVGPAYDGLSPIVGSHCLGTNHQDITGVERVVVLGDSVSVGTPNVAHPLSINNAHFWRNKLAEELADAFDLDRGDAVSWGFWKAYDYVTGKGGLKTSGDFWHCAKWGARTDDLLDGGGQIGECFPDGGSDERTLVVFTMGGNDISAITKKGGEASEEEVAAGYPEAWALARSTVDYLREALVWLKDPQRFPNGSFVVFANPFEFTDGTGEVGACPVAGLAGFEEWAQPEVQAEIVVWILEQYMQIAIDTDTDLVWMLEHFCGHGWVATGDMADTSARCYRGPDAERWFDETCIHPNEAGHQAIFEMFDAVVSE